MYIHYVQDCQIFLYTIYQNTGKYTKLPLNYQMDEKTYGRNVLQMDIEYTNFFHSKVLQNLPRFGFFGWEIYHLATLITHASIYLRKAVGQDVVETSF
jgi:hypothetical protein